MIDIESAVLNEVSAAVHAKYPQAHIVAEYVKTPPQFPCVSLMEMDNTTYLRAEDSSNVENAAAVMYEINVYSNKDFGKKTECKKLAALIDEVMLRIGFARTMLQPIPNLDSATIYRIIGRYSAVVDKNKMIYRR